MLAFTSALPLSARSATAAATSPLSTLYRPLSARPHHGVAAPRMTATSSSASQNDVRICLYGNNISITDSLRDYVDAKISKIIRKYANYCTKVDVHLSVEHNHAIPLKNAAEVVIFAGKNILRRQVRAADMYEAIDQVEDMINRTLRKFKERKEVRHQKNAVVELEKAASVFVDVYDESETDEEEDKYASIPAQELPKIEGLVKRKVFPLPLQTVEEAILCLEYIDHSFYLFRLKETGKVALVYRRNHGGYGLIEPDNPDVQDES